jgi:acyl dehydratase
VAWPHPNRPLIQVTVRRTAKSIDTDNTLVPSSGRKREDAFLEARVLRTIGEARDHRTPHFVCVRIFGCIWQKTTYKRDLGDSIGTMPVPTSLAYTEYPAMQHDVDERWTMAYAASLGDDLEAYLDTTRDGGVVAHPLFAVCPEWPVIVGSRDLSIEAGVTADEVSTGVHATHDLAVHRLVRPGDRLSTSMSIVGVADKPPGAITTTRLVTVDQHDRPVATTTQHAIYLGVPATGDPVIDPDPPPPLPDASRAGDAIEVQVPLSAVAAHVYTECARIWNPIHTDPIVARQAGLPGNILHGTANLAHGVSAVIAQFAPGRPDRVRRISGRFAAMVALPSTLTVRMWSPDSPPFNDEGATAAIAFAVLNEHGQPAVRDGLIVLGPA